MRFRFTRSVKMRWAAGGVLLATLAPGVIPSAAVAQTSTCVTPNVLAGSNFEIDANANLKVDGANPPCIDWLAGGTGTDFRTGVLHKADKLSGTGDDSFGKGTSEDNANPTIVSGSIPPNKSDLKVFGAYTEQGSSGKFLELFWSRVQNPSGTTNMDFELNQMFCQPAATPSNCANNGVAVPETPVRTPGDLLITYDLSKGGTVPSIGLRTWGCAGTSCSWGSVTVISGGKNAQALGSVNTTALSSGDTGITGGLGAQDPFTFGEVAIAFSALFPSGGQCGTFGSAYLKSRSSDSFTSEIKDFIAPEPVHISNCTGLSTLAAASVTLGSPISDTASLSGATANAGGTITFHLFSNSTCATEVATGLTPVAVNGNGDYNSGNFVPSAAGIYYWTAFYSGDSNNVQKTTKCLDADESSVVNVQPSMTTSATPSVILGSAISDTATLSGANGTAGGTITFHVFSDSTCATEVTPATFSAVTVSGNGNYPSGSFTPTVVGTYYWTAFYSGDASTFNLSVSTNCLDSNESSVVGRRNTSLTTSETLVPNDSAAVSPSSATGQVDFYLFKPNSTCSVANQTNAAYHETAQLSGGAANTTNASNTDTLASSHASALGTWSWLVSYAGDASDNASSSVCTEAFTITNP